MENRGPEDVDLYLFIVELNATTKNIKGCHGSPYDMIAFFCKTKAPKWVCCQLSHAGIKQGPHLTATTKSHPFISAASNTLIVKNHAKMNCWLPTVNDIQLIAILSLQVNINMCSIPHLANLLPSNRFMRFFLCVFRDIAYIVLKISSSNPCRTPWIRVFMAELLILRACMGALLHGLRKDNLTCASQVIQQP